MIKKKTYRTTVTVPKQAYHMVDWIMNEDKKYKGKLSAVLKMLIIKGAECYYAENWPKE